MAKKHDHTEPILVTSAEKTGPSGYNEAYDHTVRESNTSLVVDSSVPVSLFTTQTQQVTISGDKVSLNMQKTEGDSQLVSIVTPWHVCWEILLGGGGGRSVV